MNSLQRQLLNASALAGIVVVGLLLVTFRIAFFGGQLGVLSSDVSDIKSSVLEQRYDLLDEKKDDETRLTEYLKSYGHFREMVFKLSAFNPAIAFRATDVENSASRIYKTIFSSWSEADTGVVADPITITSSMEEEISPLFDAVLAKVSLMQVEVASYQRYQMNRLEISIFAACLSALVLLIVLSLMHTLSIRRFFAQFAIVSRRISEGKFSIGKSTDWYSEIWELVDSFKQLGGFEKDKIEFVRSQLHDLEKFKTIVDNLKDGVILMDADGFVVYANQTLMTQSGYLNRELIGQRPLHWKGEGASEKITDIWRVVSKENGQYEGEIPSVSKRGESYPAIVKIFPIMGSTKELRYIVAVERGLDQCYDYKSAGGELPSIISHQIKAPLQTISTAIEMLSDKKSTVPKAQIIESAQYAIGHIKQVVGEMLKSFKADSGSFNLKVAPVSLPSVFKEIHKSMDQFVKETECKISFSIPKSFPAKIHSDETMLTEVLEAIVHNAIRYSSKKKGLGEVEISAKTENDKVVITISDNGIGIPHDAQPLIFNPFFRAENAVKLQPDGSGIGLHFAKKAVEALRGSLKFESKENKGSTFYIYLPLEK